MNPEEVSFTMNNPPGYLVKYGGRISFTATNKLLLRGKYYNTNGFAVAIVATITLGIDWAAYIGGADPWSEEAAYQWVALYGAKIDEDLARLLFKGYAIDVDFDCVQGYRS